MINKNFNFSSLFQKANIFSLLIFILSIVFISFKGLNFGIDFKGGTLIELRVDSNNVGISDIRSSFSNMKLGDLNVKEFGKKGDYLIGTKIPLANTDEKPVTQNFSVGDVAAFANTYSLGYTVYTALISQTSTNAPTAKIIQDTIPASLTWR